MLTRFEVENFKNFENKLVLDLSNTKGYEFKEGLVKDGTVRGGVVFGKNASGKSNLGFALFDIVNHLTDKEKNLREIFPYTNLNSGSGKVLFNYLLKFDGIEVEYSYSKTTPEELCDEILKIDNKIVIQYDYLNNEGFCILEGTENLNKILDNNKLSFVKYINNNSVLQKNTINNIFKKFIEFVDNMLLFYSLEYNRYIGYRSGSESISDVIVRKGKLYDFQCFLNRLEIRCELFSREIDGKNEIFVRYKNGDANFYAVASTGTKALALFYYWLINAQDASFIFMDEFDAYYHYELSKEVVNEILSKTKAQVIFTSHNTNLMNNDIFRPDCLFIIQNKGIKAMCDLTEKELRKAHNLQKMYKAGAFDE
ncbi:AAA family ATPase [Thomasclavelia spiroformis]|uniref:AAA family ATPase n=1 Tax=Thomasclavelia spiroformis TaxID=29348 RepID=UPI00241DAB53|nr:ATP-binding protein [Thomasclavelia spiroformis]